jgi:hypothetical protein
LRAAGRERLFLAESNRPHWAHCIVRTAGLWVSGPVGSVNDLCTAQTDSLGCRSALRSALIVVLNEKLLEVPGDDVTQEQAFAHANDVLKNAVGGISNIIHMDAQVIGAVQGAWK